MTQGSTQHQPQPAAPREITWIASYPKSGNTWVRFMLYHALFGAPEQSLDVNRKIPDIHRRTEVDPPVDGRLLAKTHFAFSPQHPHAARTTRAVYIARHPADVLLSALNYHRLNGSVPMDQGDEQYARLFLKAGGDEFYRRAGFGTWEQHAASWNGQQQFPVHLTTYERLKADPAAELRAILGFCGIDVPDERIAAAVEATSFDSMRAMEQREKAEGADRRLFPGTEQATQAGVFFMNKGLTGQSLDERIAPGLDAALRERFATTMARLGYA